MTHLIRIYISIIALFFIISTFLNFGLSNWEHQLILIILREISWWWIILFSLIKYPKIFLKILKRFKLPLIILTILSIYSLITAWFWSIDMISILAGFKYDIYFLRILFGCIIGGATLVQQNSPQKYIKLKTFISKFLRICLIWWILLQFLKIIQPELFFKFLGYGPLWDFTPWINPPIYYLTWPNGIPRLSGIFAWPNVLWFFLVLTSWRLISQYKHKKNQIISAIILIILILLTLSRGAIAAISIQTIIITFILIKSLKKKVISIILITIFTISSIFIIQTFKKWSNLWHNLGIKSTINYILQKPVLWHWLGSSWPSLHYFNNYQNTNSNQLALLENIYLQITTDLWLIGIILFITILTRIAIFIRKLQINTQNDKQKTEILIISLAFATLLIEGSVLHVFIDSSVNWLFFMIYWLVIWKSISDQK